MSVHNLGLQTPLSYRSRIPHYRRLWEHGQAQYIQIDKVGDSFRCTFQSVADGNQADKACSCTCTEPSFKLHVCLTAYTVISYSYKTYVLAKLEL